MRKRRQPHGPVAVNLSPPYTAGRASPTAIAAALATCDDAALHAALGTHLAGGPTGTNLTDLHIVARAR